MKKNHFHVVCLQETYITSSDVEMWKKEWGGEFYFTPGTCHSNGLITLINSKCNVDKAASVIVQDRILAVSLSLEGQDVTIFNVYGPNADKDKLNFIKELQKHIEEVPSSHKLVVSGDFNMVLSNQLDIISGCPHDSKIVSMFNDLLCKTDLYDIWRIYNPTCKEFSWSSSYSPWKARRLDYILINSCLFDNVVSCDIIPVPNTDHCGVTLNVSLGKIKRGPSYWKFNQSLLKDTEYVKLITNKINILKIALESFPSYLKWDYCKNQLKEYSIIYSKQKAKKKRDALADLRNKLKSLQSAIANFDGDPESMQIKLNEMQDTKLALDLYALHEIEGAQVRSRLKWIEEGERNTKYFLGLEKSNFNKKCMRSLKDKNGKICTSQNDIIQIQVDFYSALYKKKINFEDQQDLYDRFCDNINLPTLSPEQQASCEGPVTLEEASIALSKMKNDSAPGIDGLTASFYKFFWKDIGDLVIESFDEAFQTGSLSISQRRAIITLIHKGKDLPKDQLGNWRPISLTNTDYKILAKCLALRLQTVIKEVVFEDQVGYIKGRNISTIIRLIDDVIEYLRVNNTTGVIVALDYSKAFDTIDKTFLVESFRRAGFGPEFLQWIGILMKDTESCINYCGWLSQFFPVETGIRQGCPFSPLAFVLATELLAHKIRQASEIRGVSIPCAYGEVIIKLGMYADDTTLLLHDEDDVHNALQEVEKFALFSGLKLNRLKTEAMMIGKDPPDITSGISWLPRGGLMKILGIYFSSDKSPNALENNWNDKIEKIIKIIKNWEKRNLSLMGKVHIIKTFLLSQLIYVMQCLILPLEVLKSINTIIFKFLWKKKFCNRRAFEKVRRDVLCSDFEDGGLKMINVIDMQTSFVIKWFRNIYTNKYASYSCIPVLYYEKIGMDFSVLRSSVVSKYFIGLEEIKSPFWKSALKLWLDFNKKEICNVTDVRDIANQPLWNNVYIQFKNRPLFFKNWINAGYVCVGDLFIEDSLVSLDYILTSLGPDSRLMFQYFALYNALPAAWRDPSIADYCTQGALQVVPSFCDIRINNLSAKLIRQKLTQQRKTKPCCVNFWGRKFCDIVINENVFMNAFLTTKESRLQILQWKILHNIYPTNILLQKMGLKENSDCDACGEKDYIEHFFCTCPRVRPLWNAVQEKIVQHLNYHLVLSNEYKLFGISKHDVPQVFVQRVNHVILIAKLCISKYVYGEYDNIVKLLEHELTLRKIFQQDE